MNWMNANMWLSIGLCGQIIFGSRFILQWISSERAGKSYIPICFWYLSLLGSMLLLAYAIHSKDIVFIIGQTTGFMVYIRNIMLLKKKSTPVKTTSKNTAS
jgi:lipid-A-disaccharide synthase-like uncharacterized protein